MLEHLYCSVVSSVSEFHSIFLMRQESSGPRKEIRWFQNEQLCRGYGPEDPHATTLKDRDKRIVAINVLRGHASSNPRKKGPRRPGYSSLERGPEWQTNENMRTWTTM